MAQSIFADSSPPRLPQTYSVDAITDRSYYLADTRINPRRKDTEMAVDTKTMEMLKTEPDISEGLDMSWMDATGERGISAKPGRRGLTLEEINKRVYGTSPAMSAAPTMA